MSHVKRNWDDLIGQRFGRLVIDGHEPGKRGRVLISKCDCGSSYSVHAQSVLRGDGKATVSCGCYRREMYKRMRGKGRRNDPTYMAYRAMLWRNNPKNKQDYEYYRHVGISERWSGVNGFDNFSSDMGARPPGLSLDRVDNDRGYSHENCRWADRKTQARNKSNTLRIQWQGEYRILIELCEELGIRYESVIAACSRYGYTNEIAFQRLHQKKMGTWVQAHAPKRRQLPLKLLETTYEKLQLEAKRMNLPVSVFTARLLGEWAQDWVVSQALGQALMGKTPEVVG